MVLGYYFSVLKSPIEELMRSYENTTGYSP